jgi:hypothetical protein
MRSVVFDPIQGARPDTAQRFHIIGEERQADWKHPQSHERKKPKKAARHQQKPRWNPEPATGRLPDEANGRANSSRQPIYEPLEAPVIRRRGSRLDLIRGGTGST